MPTFAFTSINRCTGRHEIAVARNARKGSASGHQCHWWMGTFCTRWKWGSQPLPRPEPVALRQQGKMQMNQPSAANVCSGDKSPHTGVLCPTASWGSACNLSPPSTNTCNHREPSHPHTGPLVLLLVLTCVTGHSRPPPGSPSAHFNWHGLCLMPVW